MGDKAAISRPDDILRGYRPLPGVRDEMVDADGNIRPLWGGLATHLNTLSPDELARNLARADRYLLDSGVYYRQYGAEGSRERLWPLSHIPVLLSEQDWTDIGAALTQRADLLETVVADIYGANTLVNSGRLPPDIVAGNPVWQRPLVGIKPRSGHFLHFLAFELGRGPDGKWWVLADRTQAPSGAGYALENRVATARAFSDFYAQANVHRLAGFFRDFREALMNMRVDKDSRVAILTPGTLNETYFEHAYIARYLGFTLVEGGDLVVSGDRLMLRTVQGLLPAEVIWRRMDSSFTDPLELDPVSRIGTPGMVAALRAGSVIMVNGLGAGFLETRALMAFLPQLSLELTGAPLAMHNIATWWCGDTAAQASVLANPQRLLIGDAMATQLPFDPAVDQTLSTNIAPDALARLIAQKGSKLVAQETVTLSTTPALENGRLIPRPMTLRVFLARTTNGWQIMPGGFARIGATEDPSAIAMQKGGTAADVWVVSDREVPDFSIMRAPETVEQRSMTGGLPARAADNLFWLGRYIERSESIVRLIRAYHTRLAETGPESAQLLGNLKPLMQQFGVKMDRAIPQQLLNCLGAALGSAGAVRDRFSPDAWSALQDIDRSARKMAQRVSPGDDAASALSALLRKLAGITGLIHENMYRATGWHFLSIGRLHERAMNIADVLAVLADPAAPDGSLDIAIEIGDSVLTHRRRFNVSTTRESVVELLGLDPLNPRALRHQIDKLLSQINSLPDANRNGALSPLARSALRLHADIATADPSSLTTDALWDIRGRIAHLSEQMTTAYFH